MRGLSFTNDSRLSVFPIVIYLAIWPARYTFIQPDVEDLMFENTSSKVELWFPFRINPAARQPMLDAGFWLATFTCFGDARVDSVFAAELQVVGICRCRASTQCNQIVKSER